MEKTLDDESKWGRDESVPFSALDGTVGRIFCIFVYLAECIKNIVCVQKYSVSRLTSITYANIVIGY